jgi:hypothetical protein
MMVFDVENNGIIMTLKQDGVSFDLDADGTPEQISWTAKDADDAILVADLNGNGRIDGGGEVIGRQFRMPGGATLPSGSMGLLHELQGFNREPAERAPPGAGQLDKNDEWFGRLNLWIDVNHDGRSDSTELTTLPAKNVTSIRMSFGRPREGTAASVDAIGNRRLFEGSFFRQIRGVNFPRQLVEFEPLR